MTVVSVVRGPPAEPNWLRSVTLPVVLDEPDHIDAAGKLSFRFVVRSCASEVRSGVVYASVLVRLGGVVGVEKPETPKLPKVWSVAEQPPVERPPVSPFPGLKVSMVPSVNSVPDVVGQLLDPPNVSDGARNAKADTKTSNPDFELGAPMVMFLIFLCHAESYRWTSRILRVLDKCTTRNEASQV